MFNEHVNFTREKNFVDISFIRNHDEIIYAVIM